jgi:uncharacterized protein YfiM (DUF2279 family)
MDSWTGEDKAFHMAGSFMAVAVLAWAIRKAVGNDILWYDTSAARYRIYFHAEYIAAALVFAAGIALEAYQVSTGADIFSLKDITANTVGIALAILVRR